MGSEVEPEGGGAPQVAPATTPRPPPEPTVEPEGLFEEARLGQSEQGRAANAVAVALSRAARSFLLYDSGNSAIRNFLEALRLASVHYLGAHGDLPWRSGPSRWRSPGR